jgi:hypothetical protein
MIVKSSISKFISVFVMMVCCSMILTAPGSSTGDWRLIDVEALFTFRLPNDFTKRDTAASQTPVGEYRKGSTNLVFRWRPATAVTFQERRQTWMNDYEELTSRIRGKQANIRTYWKMTNGVRVYHAELNVGNWEHGELELYMGLESTGESALLLAAQIFKSVTFPTPIPERPNAYQRRVGELS